MFSSRFTSASPRPRPSRGSITPTVSCTSCPALISPPIDSAGLSFNSCSVPTPPCATSSVVYSCSSPDLFPSLECPTIFCLTSSHDVDGKLISKHLVPVGNQSSLTGEHVASSGHCHDRQDSMSDDGIFLAKRCPNPCPPNERSCKCRNRPLPHHRTFRDGRNAAAAVKQKFNLLPIDYPSQPWCPVQMSCGLCFTRNSMKVVFARDIRSPSSFTTLILAFSTVSPCHTYDLIPQPRPVVPSSYPNPVGSTSVPDQATPNSSPTRQSWVLPSEKGVAPLSVKTRFHILHLPPTVP